jgi:hypothetical protein
MINVKAMFAELDFIVRATAEPSAGPGYLSDGVEQLVREAAESVLRIAALPSDALRNDDAVLDTVEQLATGILKQISSLRIARNRAPGETRGMWRVMQPLKPSSSPLTR